MVNVNQEGEQQKPTPRKQGKRPFVSENSEQNSQKVTSSSSDLFVDSTDDKTFQQHENNKAMVQKNSLEKKHSKNKYEDHRLVGNNKKKKPSSSTSSSPASPSSRRIKDQHSFESQVQLVYNQTHFQRDVGMAMGGDQGFSSNDTSVQGHTQKEENSIRDDALEAPNRTTKTTAFGKRYHTESNSLRNQGSNCRNNETHYDYLVQQAEQVRREENINQNETERQHDTTDASLSSDEISFENSNRCASDTDAKKIPTKDNDSKERLSEDIAERHHDSCSSSPHRSDMLQSIPTTSPPLHLDISENKMSTDYTTMKGNYNRNNTLEEATESQIPIPISKNAPTQDQAVEERLQKQDTSNDKKPPYVQEDDYRTKARNLARNRRKNAAEQNKNRQEEITRLTKANFELKEKNQQMINELVTLGVDAMTIRLFLNSTHYTNQQSTSALVPPPKYNLSPF
ncbi:predicted protein [Chaetoceros tenuissimus]|uniref:Uncharacterized protein n=1 Tax=Chaetoceros tenuissimus TaxID=426638 RepID=A0AAD3DA74_9STRA|nr:predicted protein [Chaetoceros tenuissimus]